MHLWYAWTCKDRHKHSNTEHQSPSSCTGMQSSPTRRAGPSLLKGAISEDYGHTEASGGGSLLTICLKQSESSRGMKSRTQRSPEERNLSLREIRRCSVYTQRPSYCCKYKHQDPQIPLTSGSTDTNNIRTHRYQ